MKPCCDLVEVLAVSKLMVPISWAALVVCSALDLKFWGVAVCCGDSFTGLLPEGPVPYR